MKDMIRPTLPVLLLVLFSGAPVHSSRSLIHDILDSKQAGLPHDLDVEGAKVAREEFKTITDELKSSIGSKRTKQFWKRSIEIEAVLQPIVVVLPQNEMGNLDLPAARDALRRYFTQEHGWYLDTIFDTRGRTRLNLKGDIFDSVNPQLLPPILAAYLDDTPANGFTLQDLAMIGAWQEDLVTSESEEYLKDALRVRSLRTDGSFSISDVQAVLTYFMENLLLVGRGVCDEKGCPTAAEGRDMDEFFPDWLKLKRYLHNTWNLTKGRRKGPRGFSFDFDDIVDLTWEVRQRFADFRNAKCSNLRDALVDLEGQCPGRVPLSKYYAARSEFKESTDYLHTIGALEQKPQPKSIVIPNLVTSAANCIQVSHFYMHCCFDHCDGLVAKLEEELGSEEPVIGRFKNTVKTLLSNKSNLTEAYSKLLKGLADNSMIDEFAEENGERVPLHSDEFAELMHRANPRDCPRPAAEDVDTEPFLLPLDYSDRRSNPSNPKFCADDEECEVLLNGYLASQKEKSEYIKAGSSDLETLQTCALDVVEGSENLQRDADAGDKEKETRAPWMMPAIIFAAALVLLVSGFIAYRVAGKTSARSVSAAAQPQDPQDPPEQRSAPFLTV